MNFLALVDKLRWASGYPDIAASFPDYRLQEYRDAVNQTVDEVMAAMSPSSFNLVKQTTFATVSGTSTYLLDDWAQRILDIYSVDTNYTYQLTYIRPHNADKSGIRNPNIQSIGRYAYTDGMRTSTAFASGAAGATTGATSAGTVDVTLGSGITLASTWVGKMFRLNGEDEDYKVTAINNTSKVVTLDKVVRPRMRGDGVSNAGTAYAAATCRWEVGPAGRLQIQILPTPTEIRTLSVRYMSLPRRLIADSDTPEIASEYHHLIWKGALRIVGASKSNADNYQIWSNEFQNAIQSFKKGDVDDQASTDSPPIERLCDKGFLGAAPYGAYTRGDGYGASGVHSW